MTQAVKEFYNRVPFPGTYTVQQLSRYGHPIENRYLRLIESQIKDNQSVLDAGCGTGLIANLMAMRHSTSQFVGIDFSNSIHNAEQFAKEHNIANVQFLKQDLNEVNISQTFDVVICQGVLHHIPTHRAVAAKLADLVSPGGILILGVYHPAGKILKKIFRINYNSHTLYQDQEQHPFELAFTKKQIESMFPQFKIKTAGPSVLNNLWLPALFNSRNGGLITYVLRKSNV